MFINDIKSLLQFKSISLYDDVNQGYLSAYGSDKVVQIISGGGYVMKDDQYLFGEGIALSGYPLNISDAMTIGFWLYPVNPGMAVEELTGNAVPITMPLIDWNEAGSSNSQIINITETTTSSGENILNVSLSDGSYSVSSSSYEMGMWHHFWIVYDGTSPSLSIYIDGKISILQNEIGSVPSSISGSNLDLYINHSINGYSSSLAKNYGYIVDICVFNVANSDESDLQKVINNGVLYISNTDYNIFENDGFGIYFDDPDTVTVTSAIDDMSYIYVGRNDGKIMRGSPLLWEVRRIFSDSKENENVKTETGLLQLKDSIIRL